MEKDFDPTKGLFKMFAGAIQVLNSINVGLHAAPKVSPHDQNVWAMAHFTE